MAEISDRCREDRKTKSKTAVNCCYICDLNQEQNEEGYTRICVGCGRRICKKHATVKRFGLTYRVRCSSCDKNDRPKTWEYIDRTPKCQNCLSWPISDRVDDGNLCHSCSQKACWYCSCGFVFDLVQSFEVTKCRCCDRYICKEHIMSNDSTLCKPCEKAMETMT